MVRLTKIYTKTGDDGTTALASGERRNKNDLRIEAYGTVDEINSAIGVARLHTSGAVDTMLAAIQNDLFDLGADLATPAPPAGQTLPYEPLRITEAQVSRLERDIDALNAELRPLNSFVLPGGAPPSAYLHVARTIARRAERILVSLMACESISAPALKYLNRLSDFLFVAARYLNDKGARDVLWVPGANRNPPSSSG